LQHNDEDWSRTIFSDETCAAVQKYDLSLVKERPSRAQENSEKQAEDHGPGSLQH
jgi:hypothetical protein